MLEYCELYCLLDTILTAEVLVHFRKVVYTTYKLDALQYISAPQLSHDAWLKTKQEQNCSIPPVPVQYEYILLSLLLDLQHHLMILKMKFQPPLK